MSWSQISSFEYDPEDWYRKYVLGMKDKPTPELLFGKAFADSCEIRKPLAPVKMLSKMEQPFEVEFDKIKLIGYLDTFDDVTFRDIGEYKSGVKKWDQKRADQHGQITMYALMNYLQNKIRPEECTFFLQWIPTQKIPRENGDFSGFDYDIDFLYPIEVRTFHTKRTMRDILEFGNRIKNVRKQMEAYALAHP